MNVLILWLFLSSLAWAEGGEELAANAARIPNGQVTLINNAPYILTAMVYSAGGDFLGQVTLQPGQQNHFVSNLQGTSLLVPGYGDFSVTPYRVVWQCAGGDIYSVCTDGSVGSYIRAAGCNGQHSCTQKQQQQQQQSQTMPPAASIPGKK